jgi:hypothetical protein
MGAATRFIFATVVVGITLVYFFTTKAGMPLTVMADNTSKFRIVTS